MHPELTFAFHTTFGKYLKSIGGLVSPRPQLRTVHTHFRVNVYGVGIACLLAFQDVFIA